MVQAENLACSQQPHLQLLPQDGFPKANSDSSTFHDIDEQEFDEDVTPIPDFQQPAGPSGNMTDKSPLDFF